MQQTSMGASHNFQPCQIVCLEHENTCLYAEVIQVVEQRQICWVRPLMLALLPVVTDLLPSLPEQQILYDLRQGSDLLWPVNSFRPALDTEVIPLLVQLETLDSNYLEAHQQLQYFVHQLWSACQNNLKV